MGAREDDPWQQLDLIADNLARVSVQVAREMVTMPDGTDLVARTIQVMGLVSSLLIDGHRASAKREADELRELLNVKSDFLRMTTHELRRPMGLLSGYLSLLAEGTYGEMPEKMRPVLRMMEAGAVEMGTLVEGLAGMARLEDLGGALRRQPTRLGHLVSDAVAAVEPEAAAKEITVEQRLPEPDILANVDQELVRIAVINLLSNAAKYAPEHSTIRVVVSPAERDLSIVVSDQGPGIDPAEATRIFDQWHRAPRETQPGLGLGLYIVSRVVELHGGRVVLESTPGKGSTFTVVLPQ